MATTPQQQPQHTTSVDKVDLARWRFSDTNGFVVKDWTGLEKGAEPVIMVLKSSDIFEFIADAGERKAKVAIYAVGPCVLDWS